MHCAFFGIKNHHYFGPIIQEPNKTITFPILCINVFCVNIDGIFLQSIHFLGFWVECPQNYQRLHIFFILPVEPEEGKKKKLSLNCHSNAAKSLNPIAALIGSKDTYPLIWRCEKFASYRRARANRATWRWSAGSLRDKPLRPPAYRKERGSKHFTSNTNPSILLEITKKLQRQCRVVLLRQGRTGACPAGAFQTYFSAEFCCLTFTVIDEQALQQLLFVDKKTFTRTLKLRSGEFCSTAHVSLHFLAE